MTNKKDSSRHDSKRSGNDAAHGVDRVVRKSTSSGLPLDSVYAPDATELTPAALARYQTRIGEPGKPPFTRGIHSTMYRGRLWTMRQYGGFGSAAETNRRYRYLLEQGVSGLSVAFDLPTQMGRDADDLRAKGEVGRVGVSISSIEDIESLFDQIPLENVSVSMTINATAHILLALYLVAAERRGITWDRLRGTIQNDILKEYIARGTYLYPPAASLRITTDIFEFCRDSVPQWNTISISGYHIREAGSSATQELAFTFADAIAYLDAARARGIEISEIAPRLAFFFNGHNDLLEEVSKFRAARRMWDAILRDRYQVSDPRVRVLRFHTQTAGSTLTAQQPLVNVVRTTIQAMAAVFGGTQSLHTNAYDEALALPTEESARLALRTQQVIAHESGIADVVDPFGGSYVVESMTDALEAKAIEYINQIDQLGGMVAAIERGYPQGEIEEAAYRYQREIETQDRLVVGVNCFGSEDTRVFDTLKIDPLSEAQQSQRIAAFRAARDAKVVESKRQSLKQAAQEERNVIPAVVDCVRERVTLGEISQTLREVFGDYVP